MYCPNCGKESHGNRFCDNCGKKFPVSQNPARKAKQKAKRNFPVWAVFLACVIGCVIVVSILVAIIGKSTPDYRSPEIITQSSSVLSEEEQIIEKLASSMLGKMENNKEKIVLKNDKNGYTVTIAFEDDSYKYSSSCGYTACNFLKSIKEYGSDVDNKIKNYNFNFYADNKKQYSASFNNNRIIAFSLVDSKGRVLKQKTEADYQKDYEIDFSPKDEPTTKNKVAVPLEIISHKSINSEYNRYIVGQVKNNTNKTYSYVQVSINLYNKDGVQVGSTLANVNNLEPGGVWNFKAIILEDSTSSYKIVGVTGW